MSGSHARSNAGSAVASDSMLGWKSAISLWLRLLDRDESSEDEASVCIFRRYLEALGEMLVRMAGAAAPRDEWELLWQSSVVIIHSKKLAHDFTFEVCDVTRQYCLSSGFAFPRHLPAMSDEFWTMLRELRSINAEVKFESNRATIRGKSIVWDVLREFEYFAGNEEDGVSHDPFLDLGTLWVSWPLSQPLEEVYEQACHAFDRLCRMNYMLYRANYIVRKSREKRASARLNVRRTHE